MGFDHLTQGGVALMLGLHYMNVTLAQRWAQKVTETFVKADLPATGDFKDTFGIAEVTICMTQGSTLMVLLNLPADGRALMKAAGLDVDAQGVERTKLLARDADCYWQQAEDPIDKSFNWFYTNYAFLLLLCADEGVEIYAELEDYVSKLSPQTLIDIECAMDAKVWGIADPILLGTLFFLKRGRDDDAVELASLAIKMSLYKKHDLSICHSGLGQVAAKRGNLDEANGHFANALNEAKQSCKPMMEVLAARDWKKHLLMPHGWDCSAAEAVIDAACAKTEKTRGDLASVLCM